MKTSLAHPRRIPVPPTYINASDAPIGRPRVATITINPKEVTVLHLRPEFESTIRMPEEMPSVILGSPEEFKAEHNEGEPEYVFVKPHYERGKAQSKSSSLQRDQGSACDKLELVSDGTELSRTNRSQWTS